MKENKKRPDFRRRTVFIVSLVLVISLGVCAVLGYEKLRAIWLEQCVITDMEKQVSIADGKMVKADVLADNFGLRPGANLALIDFAAKREEILAKIPNLRSVSIRRHLPGRVTITSEERTPIARLNLRGRKDVSGKVVDTDGVVFIWQRGTSALPTIREGRAPGAAAGARLTGRAAAALRLIEKARDPAFSELGLLEVDIGHPDFLTATIGDYSVVKIAWDNMDEPTAATERALQRTLRHLTSAIRSRVATGTVVWNATDPSGRIYADSKGNAQ